jgi:putative transposase
VPAATSVRNRNLGHTAFPYVYLDATYINVRDDALGQVVSRAVVIATGITADGGREVLGRHRRQRGRDVLDPVPAQSA